MKGVEQPRFLILHDNINDMTEIVVFKKLLGEIFFVLKRRSNP